MVLALPHFHVVVLQFELRGPRPLGMSRIKRGAASAVSLEARETASRGGSMKFCPECGTRLPSTTPKFCSECGEPISGPPLVPSAPVAHETQEPRQASPGPWDVVLVSPGPDVHRTASILEICEADSKGAARALVVPQWVHTLMRYDDADSLVEALERCGATAYATEHATDRHLAGNYILILQDPGPRRLATLKTVRKIADWDLGQAKNAVDGCPTTLGTGLNAREASDAIAELEKAGASATLTGSDVVGSISSYPRPELSTGDPEAWCDEALGLYDRGDLAAAETLWAAAASAGSGRAAYNLALNALDAGDDAEAVARLDEAIAAGYPLALPPRAELAWTAGERGLAIELMDRAMDTGDESLVWDVGQSWQKLRQWEPARLAFDACLASGDPRAAFKLGWIAEQQDDLTAAVEHFARGAAMGNVPSMTAWGRLLLSVRADLAGAQVALQMAVDAQADDDSSVPKAAVAEALYLLSEIDGRCGNKEQRLRQLARAAEYGSAPAYLNLAEIAWRAQSWEEVLQLADKGLPIAPSNSVRARAQKARLHRARAAALLNTGQTPLALDSLTAECREAGLPESYDTQALLEELGAEIQARHEVWEAEDGDMSSTDFSVKCEILGTLWMFYKDTENAGWADFFEWADVGLPTAYVVWQDLGVVNAEGKVLVEGAWTEFCNILNVDPEGRYGSLNDAFGASPNPPTELDD